jgi:hypothetical protein
MDVVLVALKAVVTFFFMVLGLYFSDQELFASVNPAYDARDSSGKVSIQHKVWPDNESGEYSPSEGLSPNPIVESALSYVPFQEVPYVWGGNSLGTPGECQACSECIQKNKNRGIKKRHLKCSACNKCGFDCSHFVQTVFDAVDYPFPFMSTKSMLRVSKKNPGLIPGLRYIGNDLKLAQPGDLLVQKKHVVILIRMKSGSVGDIVHMSRTVRKGRIGGIELRRDADLKKFFGGVKKILRHEKMLNTPGRSGPLPNDIDMAMATLQNILVTTGPHD